MTNALESTGNGGAGSDVRENKPEDRWKRRE